MTDRDADGTRTSALEGDGAPLATATCEMGKLLLFPDRLSFRGSPLQARLGRTQPDREIPLHTVTAVEWQAPSFMRMGRLRLVVAAGIGEKTGQGTAAFAFQKWERQAFEAFRTELERCVEAARLHPPDMGADAATGETPAGAPATPPAGADVPDQIRRLAQLRDDGLITADEFEAKKRDLLARM